MQLGSCDHLLCTVLAEELKMWKHWLQTAVTSEVRVSPFCLHPAKNAHVQLSDCFTKAKLTKSSLKSILPFFLSKKRQTNKPTQSDYKRFSKCHTIPLKYLCLNYYYYLRLNNWFISYVLVIFPIIQLWGVLVTLLKRKKHFVCQFCWKNVFHTCNVSICSISFYIYIYILKSCINKWLSLAFGHFATVVASDGVHQF